MSGLELCPGGRAHKKGTGIGRKKDVAFYSALGCAAKVYHLWKMIITSAGVSQLEQRHRKSGPCGDEPAVGKTRATPLIPNVKIHQLSCWPSKSLPDVRECVQMQHFSITTDGMEERNDGPLWLKVAKRFSQSRFE